MSRVEHLGLGVYCRLCDTVYDGTDACDHGLDERDGVRPARRSPTGYVAQPPDMSHHGPHMWIEVEGNEVCHRCEAVQIAPEDIPETVRDHDQVEEDL